MALFGAPIAHEDHARRACHAALHLTRSVADYADGLARRSRAHVRRPLRTELRRRRRRRDRRRPPHGLHRDRSHRRARTTHGGAGRSRVTSISPSTPRGSSRVGSGCRTSDRPRSRARAHRWVCTCSRTRVPFRRAIAVGAAREDCPDSSGANTRWPRSSRRSRARRKGTHRSSASSAKRAWARAASARSSHRRVPRSGITVKRGHGLSYGKHMPLQPILEFFRDYFEIIETDTAQAGTREDRGPPGVARRVDRRRPARVLRLHGGRRSGASGPADVGRGANASDLRHGATRDASAGATRTPLVLVFEDLHWFDAASDAFLEQLIESYPGTRTLIVTNFRPEFHARWMRHSYYRQIALSPLDSVEARALVEALVGDEPSLAPLVDSLTERTVGKPLLPRRSHPLAHRGRNARTHGGRVQARAIASTASAYRPRCRRSIGARIDRLAEGDKEILQVASVIGRTFSEPILCRIAERPEDAGRRVAARALLGRVPERGGNRSGSGIPVLAPPHPGGRLRVAPDRAQKADPRRRRRRAARRRRRGLGRASGAWSLTTGRRPARAALAARWHWRAAEWATYRDPLDALRRWRLMLDLLDGLRRDDGDGRARCHGAGPTLAARARAWGCRTPTGASCTSQGRTLAERSADKKLLARLVWSYGASYYMAGAAPRRAHDTSGRPFVSPTKSATPRSRRRSGSVPQSSRW